MQRQDSLQQLIYLLAKIPGFGPRSARRAVLHFLKYKKIMRNLIDTLSVVEETIVHCQECGNADIVSPCQICSDTSREKNLLCIVENIGDLWAIERTGIFKGNYHILKGVLSAIDGITPETLNLKQLEQRIVMCNVREVIIAISSTLDGQTTSYYIADLLSKYNIQISRLAFGIPVGAELEYMDESTLNIALNLRQKI